MYSMCRGAGKGHGRFCMLYVIYVHTCTVLVCYTNLHKHCCNSLLIFPLYQRTPLHIAARENYEHTVECLVNKGADINIKDKAGVSACEISPIPGPLV